MNRTPLLPLSALAFLLGGLPSITHADAPAPSADTFSTVFDSDPLLSTDPNRWWASDTALITWAKDVAGQGKGSLKLTNTDVSKGVITYGPYIPFSGSSITVSAEVKQDSVTRPIGDSPNKSAVSVYYYDQDRKALDVPWHNYHDSQQLPDGTTDWTSYKRVFAPRPDIASSIAYIRVVVSLVGSGTIWVDKVNVTP